MGQITVDVIGLPGTPSTPQATAGNATATVTWTQAAANGSPLDDVQIESDQVPAQSIGYWSDRLTKARALEANGYLILAHDELAKLFNDEDMLPRPDADGVLAEEARKHEDTNRPSTITGTPALLTYPNDHPPIPARSWAP